MNPCVIIPVLNGAKTIQQVVQGCRRYLPNVLVVDDGSTDSTAVLAEEAGAFTLKHASNRGKGAALKTAFDYVLGTNWDPFIVMDADGQHDPNELPKFLEAHMEDHEALVCGNRMGAPGKMPKIRVATNWFMSLLLSRLIGQKVPDTQCGYKLLPRSALTQLNLETSRYDFDSEVLMLASRVGIRVRSVPVTSIYGEEESAIHPVRDTLRFIRLVARFVRKK